MALESDETKGGLVTFRTSGGIELRGTLLRLARGPAAFEVCGSDVVLKASEALQDFRVTLQGQPLFIGRAVVSDLVNADTLLVCEAKLEEEAVYLASPTVSLDSGPALRSAFEHFLRRWQDFYRIHSDFKDVVADLQNFLSELRTWLDHLELDIRSSPSANRGSSVSNRRSFNSFNNSFSGSVS